MNVLVTFCSHVSKFSLSMTMSVLGLSNTFVQAEISKQLLDGLHEFPFADISGTPRMNSHDFGDSLTFLVAVMPLKGCIAIYSSI